jgi:gamma-glutamyl-gamma-aminobutyrate hydrolase PuuD
MIRPLIAVCMDYVRHVPSPGRDRSYLKLYPQYPRMVLEAGGIPLMLPIVSELATIEPILAMARGIVFIGSDDYPAEWYGAMPLPTDEPITPERAAFDRALAARVYNDSDLPVLAVCGGMQLAAIHGGGALVQHIPPGGKVPHATKEGPDPRHDIEIEPDSLLASVLGTMRTRVNSHHHQAVASVGPDQRVTAWAPDGVVEAMEFTDHHFRVGVQWHPERMDKDPGALALFKALVRAAGGA